MNRLPGTARWARATLLVVGAAGVVAGGWLTVVAATFETGALGELILGMLLLAALGVALFAVLAFAIAARFADGGDGVRLGAVAMGWALVVGSGGAGLAVHGAWGVGVAVGGLLALLATREDTRDWFAARPKAPRG
ncbi:hypothetical protein [Streptomyces hainanensis]|uniref:Uncharacterized protein n=1 Tax=Streptomyces hainanensis TaxID=402648 RepID=A0A4V2Y2Z3_9ACTN|nr:hypothetical protein [Streptomyces hainanensis]TDC74495.1 hypothetical protein E1283_15535 [Streptomyces hainanensis]